mmetsp:Transcript_50580/g.99517  ORF Transcript_50580/g.99517 Transcript_50580/m.99517 type:complete len:124 (-) Transcript_50580:684-1055(-)
MERADFRSSIKRTDKQTVSQKNTKKGHWTKVDRYESVARWWGAVNKQWRRHESGTKSIKRSRLRMNIQASEFPSQNCSLLFLRKISCWLLRDLLPTIRLPFSFFFPVPLLFARLDGKSFLHFN